MQKPIWIAGCIVSPSTEAFTVLAVERLAKPTDTPVFGVRRRFPDAAAASATQADLSVHSADESSTATALRSVVLMSQNSSQVTQYASMG
jgi:hypothetical protein